MVATTVPPEIHQEAARSLLERLREKTALVRWFRYNASAKHGLPIEPEREFMLSAPSQPEPEPVKEQPVPEPVKVEPSKTYVYQAAPPVQTNGTIKGILATLAILGGALATGVLGWALGYRQTPDPQMDRQLIQSPYQFLEDVGAHWYE